MPDPWKPLPPSIVAARSRNPIRQFLDAMVVDPGHPKAHIPLSLGDPTVFGNFALPPTLLDILKAKLDAQRNNGYVHSTGSVEARRAVASYYNSAGLAMPKLEEKDVVIASGCSGALDLAICALLNAGDTLLVPKPGFPLYTTLCESRGIRVLQYRCDHTKSWEADTGHIRELVGEARAGGSSGVVLLTNNPSNPCGSVWRDEHVREVMGVAEECRTPVIADEIYWNLAFPGLGRASLPAAAATLTVPVLTVGGIAKEFMVPGWRLGWVVNHDRGGVFSGGGAWGGLMALTALVLGANTLVQSALPGLLCPPPQSPSALALAEYKAQTLALLEAHATFTVQALESIPGVRVIHPQGAMYCMFQVPAGRVGRSEGEEERSDVVFARTLLAQENVFVLPGSAFSAPGFCRVVITPPLDKLKEAFERVKGFVARNYTGGGV